MGRQRKADLHRSGQAPRSRFLALAVILTSAKMLALAGCSSGGPSANLGTSPGLFGNQAKVSYAPSSAFSPYGHSVAALGGDRYKIVVGGHPTTPKPYLEKMATVRAAEFGKQQNLKYFRVETVAHAEHCSPASKGRNKKPGHGEVRHSSVTTVVSFAKNQPPDTSYRNSRETFAQLRPQLDTDPVVPVAIPQHQPPCR